MKLEEPTMQTAMTLPPAPTKDAMTRVLEAQTKRKEKGYVPTWAEIWESGYCGKKGILQMKNSPQDLERLKQVRKALESGVVSRFPEHEGKPITKSEAMMLLPSVIAATRKQVLAEMVAHMPANYALLDTPAAFRVFMFMLVKEPIFALDTETTGLDCHGVSRIVGMSFTLPNADQHVYIPIAHQMGRNLDPAVVFEALRPVLENPAVGKVLHNARFDAHMFFRHGIRLQGIAWDTQIAMALLNECEPSYALKNLANKYGHLFGYKAESHTFESLFGKDCRFDTVDTTVAACYACKDTHLTWLLYKWQRAHMERVPQLLKLYEETENPLIPVVIDMERAGMPIDMAYAKVYGEELRGEIDALSEELKVHFQGINVDSPAQLSTFLYDKLGLTPPTKKRSVDADSLEALADEHDGCRTLLEYRERVKLFGTYVDALPQLVKADGRIHGQFNQVRARTGRFSSNDPNLQNQPYNARKLFVAPPGMIMVSMDYSQIEPRVLAHISGDKELQHIYLSGVDLYSTLASKVFRLPMEQCGDGSKPRKMMKTGLLAVMYGTSVQTLSKQLHITVAEAQAMLDDFFAAYPGVGAFIARIHKELREKEYVSTMDGRKRRFPGIRIPAGQYDALVKQICARLGVDKIPPEGVWADKYKAVLPYKMKREFQDVKGIVERAQRQAVNAVIQGSAAGILKRAMIALHGYLKPRNWEIIATVHDEVILLVDETITESELTEIKELMTGAASLAVPLKVDVDLFQRWGGEI
jgi:DNA polymerase-1